MLPARTDAEGQVYFTTDPPDATCTFRGGIAVTPNGALCVLLDNTHIDPHNLTPPVIAGSGKIGEVLTATPGMWTGTPTPTITGEWMEFGHPIPGATGTTFTPTIRENNGTVSYRETASNGENPQQATSNGIHVERVVVEGIGFDNYGGGFNRAYWNPTDHPATNLLDGNYHYLKPALATTAGPGGVVYANIGEMIALAGAGWFDNNGSLGKVRLESDNSDVPNATIAGWITAANILKVKVDNTDPAHPNLMVAEVL
jgi:hypothetical protein